jgi:HD-GYP domain-containing protein (c-di-GMP phosphodiesterase class II)
MPFAAGVTRRVDIDASRRSLKYFVYSNQQATRAHIIHLLSSSPDFSRDRDRIIELEAADQTSGHTLENGAVLVVDGESAALPERFINNRGVSTVVLLYGEHEDPHSVVDDQFNADTSQPMLTKILHRAREVSYLRGRAYAEGVQNTSADKLARLSRISTSLSDVRDINELLAQVLTDARSITDADAGSIYLIEQGRAMSPGRRVAGRAERRTRAVAVKRVTSKIQKLMLKFAAAENDSIEIPFKQIVFPANMESIAGYCALTGEVVNIDDVYELGDEEPYHFNKEVIDEKHGYRTCSMLTLPLKNTSGDVVGVVQLINKKQQPTRALSVGKDSVEGILPFSKEDLEIGMALGNIAGVAIENVRLMDAISNLFEKFVIACVQAIEQRDPTTAGHSGRVDRLTMMLAETVNGLETGPFADESFTDAELVELHYASLLHDFGKIGVKEEVLTKADKLLPIQEQAVRMQHEIIRREIRLQSAFKEISELKNGSNADQLEAIHTQREENLDQLNSWFEFVVAHIKPLFLTDEKMELLIKIHSNPFEIEGETYRLIDDDAFHSLKTRKGTLNPEERTEIETHVKGSWDFLKRIPWTDDLAHVPEIAGQHHEKMNGKGYPNGTPAAETPLGSRLMAVADVFDSLNSSDRPYKPQMPIEKIISILGSMATEGDLDPAVVELFIGERIWEKLKLKVVHMEDANDRQKNAR